MDIKQKLYSSLIQLEQELEVGRAEVKEGLHLLRPIQILPFFGYGTDNYVFLKGRVMEKDKKQADEEEENSGEQSLSMVRRFALASIPNIRILASFAGMQQEINTNKEGYFEIEFRADSPINYKEAGHHVKLKLLERKTDEDTLEADGILFVPEQNAQFGVISDIDDTVLVANATSFLGQIKRSLLKDAQERSPFPGIASLLQVLKGEHNPLYYVSSSQWNMYSFLINFLEANDIPKGPLLLRDHGDRYEQNDKRWQKYDQICGLMRTYPNLNFVLIGDSGKDDPEIYRKVAEDFPDRVCCIYIRDVTDDGRAREVQEICRQVEDKGIDMLLIDNTVGAAEHAYKHGLISLPQLHQVQESFEKQQNNEEE